MNHLTILTAAGALAAITAPAEAAAWTGVPAPGVVAINPVAAYDDDDDDDDDYRRDHRYKRHGDYYAGRRLYRRDQVWRGKDGHYHCRRDDGTVGLVIGAGVGALLGREIDNRGDRTMGTILGAVGGGLLGREVDRGEVHCR